MNFLSFFLFIELRTTFVRHSKYCLSSIFRRDHDADMHTSKRTSDWIETMRFCRLLYRCTCAIAFPMLHCFHAHCNIDHLLSRCHPQAYYCSMCVCFMFINLYRSELYSRHDVLFARRAVTFVENSLYLPVATRQWQQIGTLRTRV